MPGAVPAGAAEAPLAPTPVSAPPSERRVQREGSQVHVVFGSATVPHADPRRHTLVLINTLLGGGMSSRLFQRVREELGLAYSVYTFQSFHVDSGTHGVYLGTSPVNAELAIEAVRGELARLVRDGIPDPEIAMGKQQVKGQITLAMEGVVRAKTVGVDSTTLEANAAMKSIVRRDNGQSYEEYLKELAQSAGIETLCLRPRDFTDRRAFDRAVGDALKARQVDLVCLAGHGGRGKEQLDGHVVRAVLRDLHRPVLVVRQPD